MSRHRQPLDHAPEARPASAIGANARGTTAFGAIAGGALAIGAAAIGRLAVGRLAIGRARVKRLEIGELVVQRVHAPGVAQPPAEPVAPLRPAVPRDPAAWRERAAAWVAAYERAWRTAGTDALAELFAPGATYSVRPFEPTLSGLEEIAELWEAQRDGPDETFTLTSEHVAAEGDVAVLRTEVVYGDPQHRRYRNLWVVRFGPDGRAVAFEEWPFAPQDGG